MQRIQRTTLSNIVDQKSIRVPVKTFSKGKNPHFELYWFTYQDVPNEAYEQDQR